MSKTSPFRILLVSVSNTQIWAEKRAPAIGLGYLISFVKQSIPDTQFDFRVVYEDVLNEAINFKADVVGISCVSPNWNIALKYVQDLLPYDFKIIIGGPHISAVSQSLPKGVIAGCIGEGELTFADLIQAIMDGSCHPASLSQIPGIVYWDKNNLKRTSARPFVENLDKLPAPSREYFDSSKYTAVIFTSRGCPYRCVFCATSRFWKTVRWHSPEYIVDEIESIFNTYQVKLINIYDDLFATNISRISKIIELLDTKNLLGKIHFSCSCRANLVTNEIADLLKCLGVKYVTMGLESGDETTLKYLKGSSITLKHNSESIKILKRYGIKVNAYFIIGSPQESASQILNTYKFIKQSDIDLFEIKLLRPYPGTPVWDYAKRKKLVNEENFDWNKLSPISYMDSEKTVILSEALKFEELIRLYKKFLRLRFYHNLKKIWSHPQFRYFLSHFLKILRNYIRLLILNITKKG